MNERGKYKKRKQWKKEIEKNLRSNKINPQNNPLSFDMLINYSYILMSYNCYNLLEYFKKMCPASTNSKVTLITTIL